jgi:hypothetical protein
MALWWLATGNCQESEAGHPMSSAHSPAFVGCITG